MKNRVFKIFGLIGFLWPLVFLGGCDRAKIAYDDDSIIASHTNSYLATERVKSENNSEYKLRVGSFTGVDKICDIYFPEDGKYTIYLSLTITQGRCKVVLTDSDLNVIILTDVSVEDKVEIEMKKGNYQMKVVGSESKFSLIYKKNPV